MTKIEYQIQIGLHLRSIRIKKGYSQRQLAFKANKDPQSLERVENGKSCPTVFYLNEICKALEISMSEFFEEFNKSKT